MGQSPRVQVIGKEGQLYFCLLCSREEKWKWYFATFFPFLLKDCLGSEDQSCFGTLHRDRKEEEGKSLLRYSMGCGGLIFCVKVHGQEKMLMTFLSPLWFHHSSLTKGNRHWEVDGEYC